MKRSLMFLILTLLAIACGNADQASEPPDEKSQELTLDYTTTNGYGSIPASSFQFCRPTYFQASLAHAGSPNWPNQVPKSGATFLVLPGNFVASPQGGYGGGEFASAGARCEAFHNYLLPAGAYGSDDVNPFQLYWPESAGGSHVDQQINLFPYPDNFCWITGVSGVSTGGQDDPNLVESVSIDPVVNMWKLRVIGTPALAAWVKCLHPNRAFNIWRTYVAGPGQTTKGHSTAKTFCGLTRLQGNFDDALVQIYSAQGFWWLHVEAYNNNDTYPYAEMSCAEFP
jgi:hypothetical protein